MSLDLWVGLFSIWTVGVKLGGTKGVFREFRATGRSNATGAGAISQMHNAS